MSKEDQCSYEVLLEKLGGFGLFQIRTYCVVTLICVVGAFNSLGYMFWAARPDHWCDVAKPHHLRNLSDSQWKTLVIPRSPDNNFDQCAYRNINWSVWTYDDVTQLDGNMTSQLDEHVEACEEWKFDESEYKSTIVTEVRVETVQLDSEDEVFDIVPDETRVRSLLAPISFTVRLSPWFGFWSCHIWSARRLVKTVELVVNQC